MERSSTGEASKPTRWRVATLAALLMVILSFLVFILIPNTLLGYLTTRMTPNGRDLVVVGVWAIGFVLACLVFVRLQRKARG